MFFFLLWPFGVNLSHGKSLRLLCKCWGSYRNLEPFVTAVNGCAAFPGLGLHVDVISHPAFQQLLVNGRFGRGEELLPKIRPSISRVSSSNSSAICSGGCSLASMKLLLGCVMEQKQMVYQGFGGLRWAGCELVGSLAVSLVLGSGRSSAFI